MCTIAAWKESLYNSNHLQLNAPSLNKYLQQLSNCVWSIVGHHLCALGYRLSPSHLETVVMIFKMTVSRGRSHQRVRSLNPNEICFRNLMALEKAVILADSGIWVLFCTGFNSLTVLLHLNVNFLTRERRPKLACRERENRWWLIIV